MKYCVKILTCNQRPFGDDEAAEASYEADCDFSYHPNRLGGRTPAEVAQKVETVLWEQEGLVVYLDPLGSPYGVYKDSEPAQLFGNRWVQVGNLWLRVKMVYRAQSFGDWVQAQRKQLPWWKRFLLPWWQWLFWRRRKCGNCLYFDRKGAREWRYQTTHVFGGVSGGGTNPGGDTTGLQCAFWDDVTKIVAGDYQAPDFDHDRLGYCPKRNAGLADNLPACHFWKKST